jgi:hypothetical protein
MHNLQQLLSPRSLIWIFCFITSISTWCTVAHAETEGRVQHLTGYIEDGRGIFYSLPDMKQGDIIYASMQNTGGNLDPLVGIMAEEIDPAVSLGQVLEKALASENDLISELTAAADRIFLAWDDDSGKGYSASLEFTIPRDGTYHMFAGSTITNQNLDKFQPTYTTGSFQLILGLNAPQVISGEGEPEGEVFARLASLEIKPEAHVQELEIRLDKDVRYLSQYTRNLQPGDTFQARVEPIGGAPLPRLKLTDSGGKPLAFGVIDKPGESVGLNYTGDQDIGELVVHVDGTDGPRDSGEAVYRLLVGINAPNLRESGQKPVGSPVLRESDLVTVGLAVDQIVGVDQRSENFSVVGTLKLSWHDPKFGFSPDQCGCTVKSFEDASIRAVAEEINLPLPSFSFYNQQGRRWSQNQVIFVTPDGRASYFERFTVTLQAPDFDFLAYPFDRQKFSIKVDLAVPTNVFIFNEIETFQQVVGDQLGEEEWVVTSYSQEITEVSFERGSTNSRFTTTLLVKRNLEYYVLRIFVPLFLIIAVSWVIFFLKDYGRQLEVASGNLLVFVAFNFTISGDLPRLGYLTVLDRFMIVSFCLTAIVVLISVCQKRLWAVGKQAVAAQIDTWVLVIYPLVYSFYLIWVYLRFFTDHVRW